MNEKVIKLTVYIFMVIGILTMLTFIHEQVHIWQFTVLTNNSVSETCFLGSSNDPRLSSAMGWVVPEHSYKYDWMEVEFPAYVVGFLFALPAMGFAFWYLIGSKTDIQE